MTNEQITLNYYNYLIEKENILKEAIVLDNTHLIKKYNFEIFKYALEGLEIPFKKVEQKNIKKIIIYDGDPIATIYYLLLHTYNNNVLYLCTKNALNNTNAFIIESYNTFLKKYNIKNKITFIEYNEKNNLKDIINNTQYIEDYTK